MNEFWFAMRFWGPVSLLGLWVLFYFLYREYRVDVFRQKLFALRDGLFRTAVVGDVSFDSVAYEMTRMTLNGFIHFADRMTLVSTIMMAKRVKNVRTSANSFDKKLQRAIGSLNAEEAAKINDTIHRMHLVIAEQIVLTSAVFWILLIPVIVIGLGAACMEWILRQFQRVTAWRRLLASWFYSLDDAAFTTAESG